jgi:GlpG protein
MRQIGTIADDKAARTLADYLLTQGVDTHLTQASSGWEVWVRDEDRVERARQEFAAFTANPGDTRFTTAVAAATNLRRAEERADEQFRQRQVDFGDRFRLPLRGRRPATVLLVSICVAVALATDFGKDESAKENERAPSQYLFISPFIHEDVYIRFPGLEPIRHGQVWRLVTPIFLHFSPMHLLGNMLWLYYLGSQIESRRGSIRFLALVLVIAVLSNLGEYFLGGLRVEGGRLTMHYNPRFGGMSGVVFGLFGYVWMKMRFEPELGLAMSQQAFFLSLIWLVFCFTGLAGHIANAAHASGLVVGIIVGAIPSLWVRLRF